MLTQRTLALWGPRLARIGLASWVASLVWSWSPDAPPQTILSTLWALGGLLLGLGFLCWRHAWATAGGVLPWRRQLTIFARPLVGSMLLVAGVLLAASSIAADTITPLSLLLAGAIIAVGIGLAYAASDVSLSR